jgi:hypothetical protein
MEWFCCSRFACGSFVVGTAVQHAVGDGVALRSLGGGPRRPRAGRSRALGWRLLQRGSVARAGGARGHGRRGAQAGARRDSSKLRWKAYELRRWAMAVCELQRQVMVADHGGLRAERDRMNQSPTDDDVLVVGHDG